MTKERRARTIGEGPAGCARRALITNQTACKPGFVWRAANRTRDGHSSATPVARRLKQPTRTATRTRVGACAPVPSLFGLAPGGVCRAADVAAGAVRSYRTVSPLPRPNATRRGGLFSVALSLGLPPPEVIRHRLSMEPGLSSPAPFRALPERPSSRLTPKGWGLHVPASRLARVLIGIKANVYPASQVLMRPRSVLRPPGSETSSR